MSAVTFVAIVACAVTTLAAIVASAVLVSEEQYARASQAFTVAIVVAVFGAAAYDHQQTAGVAYELGRAVGEVAP